MDRSTFFESYEEIKVGSDEQIIQNYSERVENLSETNCHPFRYWLQDTVIFFVTLVAPVLLILLGNIIVFVMVLIQIRKIRANKSSSNSRSAAQDLRAVASISVLLGVTWSMGFLSFGPGRVILMYLFTICNSFQGKCVPRQLILKQIFFFQCNRCVRFVNSLCQGSLCFSSTA